MSTNKQSSMVKDSFGTLDAGLQNPNLFQELTAGIRDALGSEPDHVSLLEGEWLFRQGDPGDSMFILEKGCLEVIVTTEDGEESVVDMLSPGVTVGEMALLTGQKRTACVRAMAESTLIKFSKADYQKIISQDPEINRRIAQLTAPRFQRTQIISICNELFGELDVEALHLLQQQMEWRHVASGEILFHQGDLVDYLAIVVSGRLRIIREQPDGSQRIIGEASRGQSVAESALLLGDPRDSTVCAVRDSELLILSEKVFRQISERYPKLLLQISRNLALRLQQPDRLSICTRDSALSLAIVPISEKIPLATFSRKLRAEIQALGKTFWLDAEKFDAEFGKIGVAQTFPEDPICIAILGWLNRQESDNTYMIYQADYEWSEWTKRCLRQADRILLIADAADSPEKSRIEQAISELNLRAQTDLVLLHPDDRQRAVGTTQWLANRQVEQHHHLRMGKSRDFCQLARRLTGRAIGLVLSGGAALGCAHLGVYRALVEAGIEPDIIGGASMGALIGAAFALDFDYEEMVKDMAPNFFSRKALLDYTFPAVALFETRKVTEVLIRLFGDVLIEDLFRPYFCVSSNLTRSQPFIHRQGPLWKSVRASIAIPGVFAPVSHDGDILVDGGVMNNLPIDIMREICGSGSVIAVNATPKKEKSRSWELPPSISGWRILLSRLNPFVKAVRVPSLMGTFLRSLEVNSSYRLQQTQSQADLIIQLDTSEYSPMDWSAYPGLIEIGYQSAREEIAAWQEKMAL